MWQDIKTNPRHSKELHVVSFFSICLALLLGNTADLRAADPSPPQVVLPGEAPPKPAPKQSKEVAPQAVPLKPAPLPGSDLEAPKCADPRLTVELFAAAPEIVTPVNICFDKRGRLLVIESHTHFRPAKYDGPKFDRIRILEDTNGDGRADKFSTYFEGTTHTMDIACHPDGTIYLATRNEILKLIDADDDGVAEKSERIVHLETKGNYPHNGLGGLMFDENNYLMFGMGENLGEPYKLVLPSDKSISGDGGGGNIYCLEEYRDRFYIYATGFWNPFGMTRDIYGHIFAVDNDPDSSPPCRMLHVVQGGDYGFQFRYGRAGKHPFQAWNGELPGTLPMMTGTGESPCEIICYESDGLPDEYRGELFVSAWADHRIERYTVEPRGASFSASRKPFIQGGKDFRPVGLAVAPDGSIYMSDWVLSNYELHGKGAVWRVKWKDAPNQVRSSNPREMLLSKRVEDREKAARELSESEDGRKYLTAQLQSPDVRVRVSALHNLDRGIDNKVDHLKLIKAESDPQLKRIMIRAAIDQPMEYLSAKYPPDMRAAALLNVISAFLNVPGQLQETKEIVEALKLFEQSDDPFIRQALVKLAFHREFCREYKKFGFADSPSQRLIFDILAMRTHGNLCFSENKPQLIRDSLTSNDPTVQLLSAKWIADDKLADFRPDLEKHIAAGGLDTRTHWAFATALARIDNRPLSPEFMYDGLYEQLADPKSSVAVKIAALRMLPAKHGKLKPPLLHALLAENDEPLRLEVLRVLADRAEPASLGVLRETVSNEQLPINLRAQALVALAAQPTAEIGLFLKMVEQPQSVLRREALRALLRLTLSAQQREQLETLADEYRKQPDKAEELALLNRLLGRPFAKDRPAPTDTAAWLERLAGPADGAAGRRVFEQTRLVNCARCHKVDGRGADVGPDLSLIGRTEPRWIVESLLQPSSSVAPHYTAWNVETEAGKTFVGLLNHTNLDKVRYIDQTGQAIELSTRDITNSSPSKQSVMPEGLANQLTDQELRDLAAYLRGRK